MDIEYAKSLIVSFLDDAEKSKFTADGNESDNIDEPTIVEEGSLNESKIEEILGNPDESDFEALFELGKKAG